MNTPSKCVISANFTSMKKVADKHRLAAYRFWQAFKGYRYWWPGTILKSKKPFLVIFSDFRLQRIFQPWIASTSL